MTNDEAYQAYAAAYLLDQAPGLKSARVIEHSRACIAADPSVRAGVDAVLELVNRDQP